MEVEGKEDNRWAGLLPELVAEVIRRVEVAGADRWPARKDVVSCACVYRKWRDAVTTAVRPLSESGKITFLSSLKQPGPKVVPIQCLIQRNTKTSTFYLYLDLSNATMYKGKFFMAARRYRRGPHVEYIISLDGDDFSQGSKAYVGKVRSYFWGTNLKIYDSQPPYDGAKVSSTRYSWCFGRRRISSQVLAGNFDAGHITYKYNVLKPRERRSIFCTMECPSTQETWENSLETKLPRHAGTTVLRNKAPQWQENSQSWCLNFQSQMTLASVKFFQLVTTSDPSYPDSAEDGETLVMQSAKVYSDIFTMAYRQPLSAFQAFAICIRSFGTKLAC